jgi:hypothetical protein
MNEDMILPDDFEMPTEAEAVEDTTPTEETEAEAHETTEEEPEVQETGIIDPNFKLKIKYNSEEVELDADRARELAQKGMNYDKVQEKLQALETDPRLSFVERMAQRNDMTVEQYLQAVEQQERQDQINELVSQGVSEHLAERLIESEKKWERLETKEKEQAEEQKKNEEFTQFFDYFRQANGRDYVPNQDVIPENVWQAVDQGESLKNAYMAHENQQLRTQLSTLKQNQSNAQKAPVGSVTAHGGTEIAAEDDFMKGFNSI